MNECKSGKTSKKRERFRLAENRNGLRWIVCAALKAYLDAVFKPQRGIGFPMPRCFHIYKLKTE